MGRAAVLLALFTALAIPAAGVAANGGPSFAGQGWNGHRGAPGPTRFGGSSGAVVSDALISAAQASPNGSFRVIVQGKDGERSGDVQSEVGGQNGRWQKSFRSISGGAATITGRDLLRLARRGYVSAITLDQPVTTTAYEDAEMWRQTTDVANLANTIDPYTGQILGPAPQAPAVAIVDSGVDGSRVADFGSRVVASVNLCSLCIDGSTADQEGHGTMVAGVAAGQSARYPGVAQNAPIVSVKTATADGQSLTSDVIAAADWILANKDKYGIKVANFSMAGASQTSFRFDPLDQAVERLWFAGITVVAAAGNFGTGQAVDMSFAPGNDPFVITVGAADQHGTSDPLDDTIAPWSAYGFTADGFSKPDLVAPGRFMVMPVPMRSTIPRTVPDRVVSRGYMWMSGTSFAAPIVAGAAAQILARHPDWGPDEVKGALMLTSTYLDGLDWQAGGVGEVSVGSAAILDFTPPNPNENLETFVTKDPSTGATTFDQAAWASAVSSEAAWASAAWASAAWASAAWASAAWASAAWSSTTFTSHADSAMSGLVTYSESTFAP
jgi:serine protease AprX